MVRFLDLASSSSLVRSMCSSQLLMILAVSLPTPGAFVSLLIGALRMARGDSNISRSLRTFTGPILGSMLSATVASRFVIYGLLMIG